ncbi:PQQ-binding-like beta-propeller repeat protein, partial [Streptomyces sp. T-3]|nr:PQQ-binding-like beta-propeller repeat protein [Streptomyces sp. T-3]
QPPTPPPAQPGYGFPSQQQPQPQQPQQPQQQYGTYQQPGFPGQPQPYNTAPQQQVPGGGPGGGKKLNTQMTIIIAAVVAVALIIGGGVWFAQSGGDDDPKPEAKKSGGTNGGQEGKGLGGGGEEKVPENTASRVLFQLPTPKIGKDQVNVAGSWLTDKVYAKSGNSMIGGYDLTGGKEQWKLPLGGPTCAGSKEVTPDGLAAVVFEPRKPDKKKPYGYGCSEVAVFDVNTGDKLWQKNVSDGDTLANFQEAVITDNTVAVGGGTDGGAAFDLKSGKQLWAPKATDTCRDLGYTGGEQLVAIRNCGEYSNPKLQAQLLDPVSGKPKWTYNLPAGIEYASVLSSKPVVVGIDSTDESAGPTDYFSLDNNDGHMISKIAVNPKKYRRTCSSTEVSLCEQFAIGNGRLYLSTFDHQGGGEYGMTNEIVSYDLKTGKQTGDKADAGERYTMFPLRMDGKNILAYKIPPYDKGGKIVSIDAGTMKETLLLENPATESIRDAETSFVPESDELLYANGRMFLAQDIVSASSTTQKNLAMGFGAE